MPWLAIPPTTLESKIRSLKINKNHSKPASQLHTLSPKIRFIFFELSLILENSRLRNLCHQVFSMVYDWHPNCSITLQSKQDG